MLDNMTEPLIHLPADANHHLGDLWRYMDWPKYEHLITSGTLWLSTAAVLDHGEGEFIQYAVANPAVHRTTQMMHQHALGHFLISCWHEADGESAHMWDCYTNSPDSVVVRTTAHRMSNSVTYPRYARLHRVQYTQSPLVVICEAGHSDMHASVLYKPAAYASEQEVRLICEPDLRIAIRHRTQRHDRTVVEHESWDPRRHGAPHLLHVKPSVLIAEVRPHPSADHEHMYAKIADLHTRALAAHGYPSHIQVCRSGLMRTGAC